jgi:rod shape-determining protein MreD
MIPRAASLKAPLRNLPLLPQRSGYKSRLNREQSPWRMRLVPIILVLLASMLTCLPWLVEQALLPPFGLMVFLAWRLMRPGLWPIWAGLPFGMFDDVFSGQPFGSAAFVWSLAMIGLEILDQRAAWRDHWQDWFIGSIVIISAVILQWAIIEWAYTAPQLHTLIPQLLISILLFPLTVRMCAKFDTWRLDT